MPDAVAVVSLILPTLNAAVWLPDLLAALQAQTWPPDEILVEDSSSTDETVAIARRAGCDVEVILRTEFNHGATRNRGALRARGDILVFMTQDALPAHPEFLARLIRPVGLGTAAATFGRQLPRPGASPLVCFQQSFHYPSRHQMAAATSTFRVFSSNNASAVSRPVFERVGGFPPHVLSSEDMMLSAKLQGIGAAVVYVPEAQVIHSHQFSSRAQFHRYFDAGVSYAQAVGLTRSLQFHRDGARFVVGLGRFLARERQWRWLPAACGQVLAKALGFQLGYHFAWVPRFLRPLLSQHASYWRRVGGAAAWTASDPRFDDQRPAAARAEAAAQGGRT